MNKEQFFKKIKRILYEYNEIEKAAYYYISIEVDSHIGCVTAMDIDESTNKIWVYYDSTEYGITEEYTALVDPGDIMKYMKKEMGFAA